MATGAEDCEHIFRDLFTVVVIAGDGTLITIDVFAVEADGARIAVRVPERWCGTPLEAIVGMLEAVMFEGCEGLIWFNNIC
jgi:hypothetical protein